VLPPVSSAADAAKAAAALLEAVAVGDLPPAEASELGKLIEAYIKALEATEFAERLAKLERRRAIVRVPRKALPKNGEFGHMCVPPQR
jgi:hypothetical protein